MSELNNTVVSGAVGTAQQYSPNAPNVYQQQLRGVSSLGAPMQQYTNDDELLATGLSQLGIAWQQYTNDEEERKYSIAKEVSPQIFANMTEEEKHKLDTRQILATDGKFNLQDNEYAIATIDRMKGTEVMKSIETKWQLYQANRPTKKTLEEELADFDNFVENELTGAMEHERVENEYSFNQGLAESRMATKTAVYNDFRKTTEETLKLERINGLSAKAGSWARNASNASEEDITKNIQALIGEVRNTMTSDTDLEYRTMGGIINAVASTGQTKALDILAQQEYKEGKTVGDMFDFNHAKDLANVQAEKIQNDRYLGLREKLQKITTEAGVNQFRAELKASNQEDYRLMTGDMDRRVNEIEVERKRQEKLALLQAKKAQTTATASSLARSIYGELKNGKSSYNGQGFPKSDADVKAMGGDPTTYLAEMNKMLIQDMGNGNFDGVERILNNSYVSAYAKKEMNDSLNMELANLSASSTELPEVLGYAIGIAKTKPHLINYLLPSSASSKVLALSDMIDSTGSRQTGISKFGTAMQKLNDSNYANNTKEKMDKAQLNPVGVLDAVTGEWTNTNPRGDKDERIRELATIMYASGDTDVQTAMDRANAIVMHSYINYKGTYIPRTVLAGTGVSSEAESARLIADVIKDRQSAMGVGTTTNYDEAKGILIIESVTGLQEQYTLQELGQMAWNHFDATSQDERDKDRQQGQYKQDFTDEQYANINEMGS